jgi:hypothetical protein
MVLPLVVFNNNILYLYFMWTIIKKFHHGTSVQRDAVGGGTRADYSLCGSASGVFRRGDQRASR